MLSSVEQAFVGRELIRVPLKTPAWEARSTPACIKRLTGNENSASEIKILSNKKPQEIDAQETGRLYELKKKKTKENIRVRIFRQSIIYLL